MLAASTDYLSFHGVRSQGRPSNRTYDVAQATVLSSMLSRLRIDTGREKELALKSFKIDLHAPTSGCIATDQRIESVGLFLASFARTQGISGTPGTLDEKGKSLEKQKIAVS